MERSIDILESKVTPLFNDKKLLWLYLFFGVIMVLCFFIKNLYLLKIHTEVFTDEMIGRVQSM